jgi:putative ABC transport system permease protein
MLLLALLATATPVHAQGDTLPPIAVERRLAADLGLGVGDTLRLGPEPGNGRLVRVAAIYEPSADPATVLRREYRLRMHLPDLAGMLGAPDRVDRFGITLRQGTAPDSAARILDEAGFGYGAVASEALATESSQTFRVISRFHRAIAVISVAASAIFLLCIMLLKVEERRLDAAMLRFIGISRRTVFLSLLLEAALVAVAGSAVGAAFAWLASRATNAYYQRYFDTSLVFSWLTPGIVRFSVAVSLVLGLTAGALAAWRLVRTRPSVLWGRG